MQLTEAIIRRYADSRSFERGLEYYHDGAVDNVVRRGNTLRAEVEGSDAEPYDVTVAFGPDGAVSAECDCPYDYGGWCKHIVAVCLHCLNEPEAVEELAPLDALLAPLNADALRTVLTRLATRHPHLADDIESEVASLQLRPATSATPTGIPTPAPPAAVDPAQIRKKVRACLKSIGRGGYDEYGDDTGGYDEMMEGIRPLIEIAESFVVAGDGRGALPVLEAITDAFIDDWDIAEDIVGDASELMGELGGVWAEAILTADLTAQERKTWAAELSRWQEEGDSCGADSGLAAAVEAARYGWDYPPLLRVLQGEITDKGAWEDEPPDGADELAVARINVLERQGRLQEAAYVAEAEGQSDRYMALLVKMRRAQQAADYGIEYLTTAESAHALALTLHAHGETVLALRVAEHGLWG